MLGIFQFLDFYDLYNFLKLNRTLYSYFLDPEVQFKIKECSIDDLNLKVINRFPKWKFIPETIIFKSNNIAIFKKINPTNLTKIVLESNNTDFKFLSGFYNLISLKLEGCYNHPFTSFPTNIEQIFIGNMYNQEISEFTQLPNLKVISFGYTFNQDISQLAHLPNLKVICLENIYSQDISLLFRIKNLCILSKSSKLNIVNVLQNNNLENSKYIRLSELEIVSSFKLKD